MDSGDPQVDFKLLKDELRELVSEQLAAYVNLQETKSMEGFRRVVFKAALKREDLKFIPTLINAVIAEVVWDEGYFETVANWRLEK
jgi:hypothetical protein